MKIRITLILLFVCCLASYSQKSIVDVQPPPVQLVKPTNKSGANAFKLAAGMLIVNGLLGAYLNSQSHNTGANVPRVSPEAIKNLTYVRHATLIIAGGAILFGAESVVSTSPKRTNYPQ